MYKKFTVLFLLAASCVIFLPTQGAASTTGEKTTAIVELSGASSIAMTPQRRRRRSSWNNRYNTRNRRWNSNRRTRVIRQVYYRNGRRYVRIVRVRY